FTRLKRETSFGILLKNATGDMIGYGLSIAGPRNLLVGPIVAPDTLSAARLIHHLARHHQGPVRIDVPSQNNSLRLFLEQRGFVQVSQPPVMMINATAMPPRNGTLFGIAAQVFG
ncbi:acetyltransferase, partial [Fictibacillus macauensis ZFHKF-1]